MDKGAWQATVHGVTESWTRLKRLCSHVHFTLKCLEGKRIKIHQEKKPKEESNDQSLA